MSKSEKLELEFEHLKFNDAVKVCVDYIASDSVPALWGSPGIGKSALAKEDAKKLNLELIDFRLTTADPVDLNGFPAIIDSTVNGESVKKASYIPFDVFPTKKTPLPEGKQGWLLFLDELPTAIPAVQTAAYKPILDRIVGQTPLHKRCFVMAAGNLKTDGAFVQQISSALLSRMGHVRLVDDKDTWLDWASNQNKINSKVISWIRACPDMFNTFQNYKGKEVETYSCPRSLEKLGKLLNRPRYKDNTSMYKNAAAIKGIVGNEAGQSFITFCEVYKKLVSFEEILANPLGAKIPEGHELSLQWALTSMLSENITKDNFKDVIGYIDRLEKEYQYVILLQAGKKGNIDIYSVEWIDKVNEMTELKGIKG